MPRRVITSGMGSPPSSLELSRRYFLGGSAMGVGACALATLLGPVSSRGAGFARPDESITAGSAHHRPKARRVISLFQSGGPSQLDLFDPKPSLFRYAGADMRTMTDLGIRLTGMTRDQGYFPVVPSAFEFSPSGQSGIEISSLLPATAAIVDEICLLRAVRTHAINHDPAITFLMTGSERPGRPSAGAWVSYALGCGNDNLPAFVVLSSHGTGRTDCQPLYERLWDSGFLPARHRGTGFLPDGDPFLYLENPPGFDQSSRRFMLDMAARINSRQYHFQGDPRILDRMRNMEMAARMQTAVPELTDLRDEPASVLRRYGPDVSRRGSYAWNCLMARRLAERDVRFIQLFHTGWDQHFHLPEQLPRQCADTDRPTAALIEDLRIRGLLDDTLVIWGGEFGRTLTARDNTDMMILAGITMLGASVCGWPVGAFVEAGSMVPLTSLASARFPELSMFMISTQRCSIFWAWITGS